MQRPPQHRVPERTSIRRIKISKFLRFYDTNNIHLSLGARPRHVRYHRAQEIPVALAQRPRQQKAEPHHHDEQVAIRGLKTDLLLCTFASQQTDHGLEEAPSLQFLTGVQQLCLKGSIRTFCWFFIRVYRGCKGSKDPLIGTWGW